MMNNFIETYKRHNISKANGSFVNDDTIGFARSIKDIFNLLIKLQMFPYSFKLI